MKQALAVVVALTVGSMGLFGCEDKKKGSSYQGEDSYYYSNQKMDSDYDVDQSSYTSGEGSAYQGDLQRSQTADKDDTYSVHRGGKWYGTDASKPRTEKTKVTEKRGSAYAGEECAPCEDRSFYSDLEAQPKPRPVGMARIDVKTGIIAVTYRIDVANVDNITGAFVHHGQTDGKLGPIVATLYQGEAKSGNFRQSLATGSITADKLTGPMQGKDLQQFADEVNRGNMFVRVTSTDRPEGVLVGKLGMEPPPAETRNRFVGENPPPSGNLNPSDTPSDIPGGGAVVPADNSNDMGKDFFAGEERGPLFMALLTPPSDTPDARARFWIGANKDTSEIRYRLMLKGVENPTGANLYLVEKAADTPATQPAGRDTGVSGAGERIRSAVERSAGIPVDQLGEPIAKLRVTGDAKTTDKPFAEGTLSKDDLMGALKGKDLSTLMDHIRQGHVFVAILTEKHPNGDFNGRVTQARDMEKPSGSGFQGDNGTLKPSNSDIKSDKNLD